MARVRTFIAVELDTATRARLQALQEALARAGGDVKWVEADNMHLTLLFLGEVDERDLNGVCKAVAAACAGVPAFGMSVEGVGSFGGPRGPRTLWAGVGEGLEELTALHAALEAALMAPGGYRREDRRYNPHITLGRVRSAQAAEGLAAAMDKQQLWHGGEGEVKEVVVMSSEIRSEGPVYAVLSRARLAR